MLPGGGHSKKYLLSTFPPAGWPGGPQLGQIYVQSILDKNTSSPKQVDDHVAQSQIKRLDVP